MPKPKSRKRKVKEVQVPEGDEGKNLTVKERAEKLQSFTAQFRQEVQKHLDDLEQSYVNTCIGIENAGRTAILALTPEVASMPIMEYRLKVMQSQSRRDSEVEGANISAVLNDVGVLSASNQGNRTATQTRKKVTGFATPAVGGRETLWTATPKHTPLFDKRLLNVASSKPAGLSLNGQSIENLNVNKMSKANKQELSRLLTSALNKLK